MDTKIMIGEKIRTLREKKGLSREDFCENESDLTVRQLSRIELGQSLPTIPKLTYISKQLAIPIPHLIGEKDFELPKEYLQIKHILYKFSTYAMTERVKKKENYFDIIYEKYYDDLPEEEQLSIDVMRASTDVHTSDNTDFGAGILGDYFYQIEKKQEFSINDLLIINLYFLCAYYKGYDKPIVSKLLEKLVNSSNYTNDIEFSILNKTLISAMNIFTTYDQYDEVKKLIDFSNKLMEKNQIVQKKPIVDMVEGKYLLFSKKDQKAAKQKYQDAEKLALLLGDSSLAQKINQEYYRDLDLLATKDAATSSPAKVVRT